MARQPFETRIQDIVYNVDVGIGLRLIKAGLYLLFIVGIAVLYTATEFRGLRDAEAMDLGQIARNISEGRGFTTKCIRPASLWYLIEKGEKEPVLDAHPDLLHAPAYPYLLAGVFSLTDGLSGNKPEEIATPEIAMIVTGHVLTFIAGLLLFFIARMLFDPRIGLLGVTLFFLSDKVWDTSILGTGLPLVLVLVLAASLLALIAARAMEAGHSAFRWLVPLTCSAVFTGLAFLTRYGAIVFIPAFALFVAWSLPRRGTRWGLLYALIALAVASPWIARNIRVSGGPFGLAPYVALNPGTDPVEDNDFERTLAPELTFDGTARAVQVKLLTGLDQLYHTGLPGLGEGLLAALFLTTFLYRFAKDTTHRFRWGIGLALAGLWFLGALFGEGTARLLYLALPFATLYGLSLFFILLDRLQVKIPAYRLGILAVLVLTVALPLAFRLLPPRAGTPYPPYFPPYIRHVCKMLKADEVVCTDMPWATAWYGDRISLLLPMTLNEFYSINDYTKRVSGIYFTTLTRDRAYVRQLMTGSYRTWFPILEGRIPNDFPLTQGFPLNNLDQLFLTDRPRWEDPGVAP